ncbi:MAG: FkbM family methyltransferase [Alphaproteobacteria bacterium]|nr:MAG: FkbM family methyltransferase [Alphaproteobacteria bacterium]
MTTAPSDVPELQMNALYDMRQQYLAGNVERANLRQDLTRAAMSLRAFQRAIADTAVSEIRISGAGLIATFASGLKMHWNPEDLGSAPNIAFIHGGYEQEETKLLTELSRDKTTVLDIGANVGWFALHIASVLSGADRKIYAFEPIPRTYSRIVENVELNKMSDVIKVSRLGFSDQKGETTFYVPMSSGPSAASIRNLHPEEVTEPVVCSLNTVDDFLTENDIRQVDLVKCDVEGAELLVLNGARSMLEHQRPVLFLELLRKWSREFGYHPNAVIELLAGYGYACWAVGKGSTRPIESIEEETVETNFLFLTHAHARERNVLTALGSKQGSHDE